MIFPRYNRKTGWIGFTNMTDTMKSDVYLLNKKRNKVRKIFSDSILEDFSPDGESLLYTKCNGKGELYMYHIKSKKRQKISQNLKVTNANWSPDGKWIAVSALEKEGVNDLYIISATTLDITKITNTPRINESHPVLSADGKTLTYFSDKYGKNKIEFYDLKTKEIRETDAIGAFPCISSDSNWIVYQNAKNICLVRKDGLGVKVLCKGKNPIWLN